MLKRGMAGIPKETGQVRPVRAAWLKPFTAYQKGWFL